MRNGLYYPGYTMCWGASCFRLPSTFFPHSPLSVTCAWPQPWTQGWVCSSSLADPHTCTQWREGLTWGRSGSFPGVAKMGMQLRLLVIPFLTLWREPVCRWKPSRGNRDGRQTTMRRDLMALCPCSRAFQNPSLLHEPWNHCFSLSWFELGICHDNWKNPDE